MKFQARCMWRMSECALYCVATPMRRIDDARHAAEIDRGLGAIVGQLHEATAAPAGQHIGHGFARQRLSSHFAHRHPHRFILRSAA
jgi:hypothetical protein